MISVLEPARILRLGLRVGERPDRLPRAVWAMRPYPPGVLAGLAAGSARYPERVAVAAPSGNLTFGELWSHSGQLANALRKAGVVSGTGVGLLAHNDRYFVLALVAAARTGADVVLLNTAMAGPQLADVVATEQVRLVLHDAASAEAAAHLTVPRWDERDTAEWAGTEPPMCPAPPEFGDLVVLTSGTTGRPKGARRPASGRRSSAAAQAFATRLPWRVADTVVIPAPFFHAWGLAGLMISLSLSCTVVTRPSFDPEQTLADVAEHRASLLLAVPVMLQRIVALPPERLVQHDTTNLRGIVSSGSALPAPVARAVLHRFGPVLYNVYGSTEVSAATLATPADLREDPASAGRPVPGVRVEVFDGNGEPAAPETSGRVFVGSTMAFRGYTSGESRETLGGLVSTGDVGHWDGAGRLSIIGREDDMVVSGGENVYPGEVEDLLAEHPDIEDLAVAGCPDEDFGQALVAWVVRRPGSALDSDEVREFVRARLARFKVPRRVEFVDELPRTATGKVQRGRLT